jgi:hypothetical protein
MRRHAINAIDWLDSPRDLAINEIYFNLSQEQLIQESDAVL